MYYRRRHDAGWCCARLMTFSRSRPRYRRSRLWSCSDRRYDSLWSGRRAFRICYGSRCLHSERRIVGPWTVVRCWRRRWSLSLRTLRANQNQQEYISEGNYFHVLKCNQLIQGHPGRALGLRFADAVLSCQQMRGKLAGGKKQTLPEL